MGREHWEREREGGGERKGGERARESERNEYYSNNHHLKLCSYLKWNKKRHEKRRSVLHRCG